MNYYFLMLIAIVVSFGAQMKVKSAYNKWSQVANSRGMTGADVARRILDANGLYNVSVVCIDGTLTDNYNPKTNVVSLSQNVYNGTSVAAIGVAAHEVGHAIQHSCGYLPIKLRSALVPVANFGGSISWILIMIGLGLSLFTTSSYGQNDLGYTLAMGGVILYAAVTAFHLVTLPVELNASSRARRHIDQILAPTGEEMKGVRKVLSAAAMTYVAALFTSAINLLRMFSIVSGSRRR